MLACHSAGTPQSPAFLLLHGFMGRGNDWQLLAEDLQKDFFCLMPDLPGHGDSLSWNTAERWNISTCAAACIAILDARGISRCYLLGYSMGGRLALYLACFYPHRFYGVILESASPGLRSERERAQRRELDEQRARELEAMPLETFLERWYAMPLFAATLSPEQRRQLCRDRRQNNPAALARSLRETGTGSQPSLWPRLAGIDLQLLLLVGKKDPAYCAIAQSIAAQHSRAVVQVISGCGHNVHLEDPAAYLTALRAWLAQSAGSRIDTGE